MIETNLNGKTIDIAEENIKKLKEIFPEVFTEEKVDFEKLQHVLGNYIETSKERYNFTWNGKSKALRISQTPSTGTLRPCKEESKDWDTTQNLYIEGDNLEVLKLLQKSYHGKVKMIYIDPPYNTGNDFVYPDNFTDSIENYKEITGQVGSDGKNISSNSEISGRYHTDWLNMMYPRLRLARNLLKDDGVIFISIDDNEASNLKKLCDDIFGEDNFEAQIKWRRRHNQPNDKTKIISRVSEYILVFSKNSQMLKERKTYYGLPLSEDRINEYRNPDNDIRGDWSTNPWKAAVGRGGSKYKITTPTGKEFDETWYGTFETFKNLESDGRVHWTDNGNGYPRIKIFLNDAMAEGQAAIDFFTHEKFGSNQEGSAELDSIFNHKGVFTNPKPSRLLHSLVKLITKDEDIILDFFSGSSTTAHAVMQLNTEDSGKRKFIMVQLQESTDEKSEAFKAGYKNICEIGKERIRRAGEKIKEEKGIEALNLDIGFKVLKLDSSNVKKWQPDYDNLDLSITDYIDNFVKERTELDIVYEIILKYGLDLTYPVDEYTFNGKKVYSIGFGMLIICLDNEITTDVANGIIKLVNELSVESARVVFKDNGFKTDSNKTNIKEILKCGGIEEFITI